MSDRHERLARLRRRWAAWLVALALLAYGPALAGDYVFDDLHSIAENPAVHDVANIGRFWTDPAAFSRGSGHMYRPMLLTSFALNMAWSAAPWSLKLGNVLLHVGVVWLLFRWLADAGRSLRAAAVAAAVFAVHPLASEAINLVSARSELLSTLGLLVGLWAHVRWQRHHGTGGALAAMVFGAVCACGSKETGVVLPALLVAQTWCLRQRRPAWCDWQRAATGIAPVVVVVVGYLVARKLLLGEVAVALLDRPAGDPRLGFGRTLGVQLATMGTLLPRALWQCVWPWPLSLDPVVQFRSSWWEPAVLGGWATVLGLTGAALWPGVTARLRRIGIVLVWMVALPWILIPLNMPLAEHRLYAPLCGLAAIAAALLPHRSLAAVMRPSAGGLRLAAPCVAVLALAMVGSMHRSLQYRDEERLWRHELAQNPRSFAGWWGLGTTAMRKQDFVAAIEPLARATELNPEHYDALRNYTEALLGLPDQQAQPARAIATAEALQARGPRDPWVRTLVVQAHLQAGRLGGGIEHFARAETVALSCLQIGAPKGYVYQLAAAARRGLGDLDGALAHLDTSIARQLGTVGVRLDRAAVLRALGRLDDARRELLRAQQQAPFDPAVQAAMQQLAVPPR